MRSGGLAAWVLACPPFGSRVLLPAFSQIVRAVFQPVGGLYLGGRLFVEEGLAGLLPCRYLVFGAIAQSDFLAGHEERLTNRQVVGGGNRLARLQDVAELGVMDVPIGLNSN